MKEQLEQLYGEYMQLQQQSSDYAIRNAYADKMEAIETLLQKMPYDAENPILS